MGTAADPQNPPGRRFLRRYVETLTSYELGRRIVEDFGADVAAGRIPREIRRRVLAKILDLVGGKEGTSPAEQLVLKVLCAIEPFCCGPRCPPAACGRVMAETDFFSYNIEWPGPLARGVPEQKRQYLRRHGITGVSGGRLKGRFEFAWVTKLDDLNALLSTVPPGGHAEIARNRLGLGHMAYGRLYLIVYPEQVWSVLELHQPTVLDGSCSLYYRSVSGRDCWGRARDLEHDEEALPEAVHPAIPFTDDFDYRDLGDLPYRR